MNQKQEELNRIHKRRELCRVGRLADDARNRLKRIASKKFRTCFIAALSEFENTFGFELWGHNMPDDMITHQQKINRVRWEQIRKNILDKGNTQSRALGMEIDLHHIEFEGYNMNFGGTKNEEK